MPDFIITMSVSEIIELSILSTLLIIFIGVAFVYGIKKRLRKKR